LSIGAVVKQFSMLVIRLQRLGRKGYPVYRLVVQEKQRHPSSGRVVAYVGTFNPHSKEYKLDKEKIELYIGNGAQPTPRVVKLLQQEKVKLPDWVTEFAGGREGKTRFPDKLRKNQPDEPVAEPKDEPAPAEEPAPAAEPEAPAEETPAEQPAESTDENN
jgi:small subunit ribosomal protein S16